MQIRFKLFSFMSKTRSGSLLEFNISPEKPANAVGKRIGFQTAGERSRRPEPKRHNLTVFSLFELFRGDGEES